MDSPLRHLPNSSGWVMFLLLVLPQFAHAETPHLKTIATEFKPTPAEQRSGAVVLTRDHRIRIVSEDRTKETTYTAIAILDEQAAEDYSIISLGFNSHFTDLALDYARLTDPNGNVHALSADAVQVRTGGEGPMYQDIRYLTFSLPAVQPGSFIEYHVKRETRRPQIPGFWSTRNWLYAPQDGAGESRIDPVRRSTVILDLPRNLRFSHRITGEHEYSSRSAPENRKVVQWEFTDLPEIPIEDSMPPLSDRLPVLYLSSIPDWQTIDTWGRDVYLAAAEPTAGIRDLASAIMRSDMSRQQKIEAAFYYMQNNIRYISADVSRGGLVPHDATTILANRYGDCKDQATLLVSLLRSQGIEAYPALIGVYPEGGVREEVPSLSFSHMIVHVPSDNGDAWLDTSVNAGSFPGIGWRLANRKAFVINGRGGELKTVAPTPPGENRITLDTSYAFDGKTSTAVIQRTVIYGQFAHHFKNFVHNNPTARAEFKKSFTDVNPNIEVTDYELRDAATADGPLEVVVRMQLKDTWLDDEQETMAFSGDFSRLFRLAGTLALSDPKERTHDYNLAFPYSLEHRVSVKKPGPNFETTILTPDLVVKQPWFSLSRKITKTTDGALVTLNFESPVRTIGMREYPEYHDAISRSNESSKWQIGFTLDETASEISELRKKTGAATDATKILALARHHLNVAEFEKAASLADKALSIDDNSGEAHYLRGMALGFLEQFDASEQALQRARSLGYRP